MLVPLLNTSNSSLIKNPEQSSILSARSRALHLCLKEESWRKQVISYDWWVNITADTRDQGQLWQLLEDCPKKMVYKVVFENVIKAQNCFEQAIHYDASVVIDQ